MNSADKNRITRTKILAIGCALLVALCFFVPPWLNRSNAQQLVAGCIQVYNSANGSGNLTCAPWSPSLLAGLSSTATQIKGAPGILGGLYCYNPDATVEYVQVFDAATAASVTVGTTSPKLALGFTSSAGTAALPLTSSVGVEFLNGIQVAATTTATGSSAPATALNCSASYN